MLIIDFSQIAIASLMVQTQAWKKGARVDMNIDLIRHIVLKGVLEVIKNHRTKYGQVIIACDHGTSWRKAAFQYYKYKRAETKQAYNLDWTAFYTFLNKLIEEIRESFPYIVVNIPHAEGDDIIGTIVRWYQDNQLFEEILIVSGDKDFKQLHNERTRQYSPILRTFIGTTDPEKQLKDLIIKGDRGDGVPNILSADTCFALQERQTKMSAQRLKKYMELDPEEYEPTVQRNWHRNKLLIDLSQTPERLRTLIVADFKHQLEHPTKNGVFDYLFKHDLKELLLSAGDY